jgi:hypothetical protein
MSARTGDEINIQGNMIVPNQHPTPIDAESGAPGFRFDAQMMTHGPLTRAPRVWNAMVQTILTLRTHTGIVLEGAAAVASRSAVCG